MSKPLASASAVEHPDGDSSYTPTEATTLRRFAFRARYDRKSVHAILDSALMCHVGYVRDGQPMVTPTSFWREGEVLYWHGSAESSMLREVAGGIPVCFTVSHADGLVLSRVMSRHSFNYRSVIVQGHAVAVTDPAEKLRCMKAFVDRLLPGRWSDGVQTATPAEIERITIVRMDLLTASAKVRGGPPKDSDLLYDRVPAWAGHVPFKLAVGQPVPDPNLPPGVPVPGYVRDLAARFGAQDLSAVALDMPEVPLPSSTAVAVAGAAAAAVAAPPHRVSVPGVGVAFEAAGERTLLESALRAGVSLPFSCAAGGCGSCKVRLVQGRVDSLPHEPAALKPAEAADGWILACCARPRADCVLALPERAAVAPAASVPAAARPCRVVRKARLTHDIVGLWLCPLDERPLPFEAGQYLMLQVAGLPEREYSVASLPGLPTLEFNIRVPADGWVSRYVAEHLAVGDTVQLRGPFGVATYQDDPGPIVALAGGTGLAPIRSIVQQALVRRPLAAVDLYIGARDEPDFYALDELGALRHAHPGLRLRTVASAASDALHVTTRRTGWLADALRADAPDLSVATVYVAGPPLMTSSCVAAALALGADPARVHVDAFLNAADKRARLLAGDEA